jgi:hypothetical protein
MKPLTELQHAHTKIWRGAVVAKKEIDMGKGRDRIPIVS